jgi:hypothetical protein
MDTLFYILIQHQSKLICFWPLTYRICRPSVGLTLVHVNNGCLYPAAAHKVLPPKLSFHWYCWHYRDWSLLQTPMGTFTSPTNRNPARYLIVQSLELYKLVCNTFTVWKLYIKSNFPQVLWKYSPWRSVPNRICAYKGSNWEDLEA